MSKELAKRLTQVRKDQIVDKAMSMRFDDQAIELMKESQTFFDSVYKAIYSDTVRRQMINLPKGWLGEHNTVSVTFGGEYCSLNASGMLGQFGCGNIHSQLRVGVETKDYRFLHKHRNSAAIVFEHDHFMVKNFGELRDKCKDFLGELKEARSAIKSMVNSASTGNALIRAWPEIAPIVEQVFPKDGDRNLPAPEISKLNEIFKLPIEAK